MVKRLGWVIGVAACAASVLAQLRAYKAGPVTGIPYPDAMHIALTPMTDADLTAVAAYVATLK